MPDHAPSYSNSNSPRSGTQSEPVVGRNIATFCGAVTPGRWPERRHSHLKIILPLDGTRGKITQRAPDGGEVTHELGASQLAVIGKGQVHGGYWHCAGDVIMLQIKCAFVRATLGRSLDDLSVHDFATLARRDVLIADTASAFRRLGECEPCPTDAYLDALGTIFATHVLRALAAPAEFLPNPCGLSPRQLRAVTDFIAAHLNQTLRVDDLARVACLSPSHFMRCFRHSTGLSPHRYLIRRRVERADELLRSGNVRVSEAAHEVGFCDQSHLDRHFRRRFGFSPKTVIPPRR